MTQLDAGISGGKAPLHWLAGPIALFHPGAYFVAQRVDVRYPTSQTLPCQHAELAFSDVQPTAVFRRIHELQLVQQRARPRWLKGLVQRRPGVRTQVVHQQRDPLRLRIVFFHQPAHPFRPGRRRMVRRHIGPPPIIKRRVVHQQMSHPVALVLGVVARCMARTHPLRWPDLLHALLARLIHADHRKGRIVRPGIHFQDVLHPAHEGGVLLWRDAPHLLSPRLELVFFSTLRTVSWDIERTTRRRFNSSHSICRVHRARPAGGSLQAMATNRASPSPSSTVARSRLRLRRTNVAAKPSCTQRLRTFSTVCRVTPTCSTISVSGCPGPCSPWSANSRIRAFRRR